MLSGFRAYRKVALLLTLGTCFVPARAFALRNPLTDVTKLPKIKKEKVARVKTARVVVADYALIRRDFPSTEKMTDPQIDAWLLDKTAYISIPQIRQAKVNTEISYDLFDTKEVYRPIGYGRAWVAQADGKLFDVKGGGSLDP